MSIRPFKYFIHNNKPIFYIILRDFFGGKTTNFVIEAIFKFWPKIVKNPKNQKNLP